MFQNAWEPPPQPIPRGGRGWLHTLWVGILLFVLASIILFLTGNPNLYPTVILIGNFLIPVVFVAFLYDHQHLSTFSTETVGQSFAVGGILGVLGASVLESFLLQAPSNPNQGLSLGSAMLVGLIEEGCKIAAVMFLARRMQHTSQMDGLLMGAAVGMGFAALESTGYAFTALLTQGHVVASLATTILRGLFAPFGHGIWSGILGAVLFQQSGSKRFRITGFVVLTYLFVSVLHGLWDGLPLVVSVYVIIPPGIPISLVSIIIGIIGVIVLTVLYRRALRQRMYQAPPVGPLS